MRSWKHPQTHIRFKKKRFGLIFLWKLHFFLHFYFALLCICSTFFIACLRGQVASPPPLWAVHAFHSSTGKSVQWYLCKIHLLFSYWLPLPPPIDGNPIIGTPGVLHFVLKYLRQKRQLFADDSDMITTCGAFDEELHRWITVGSAQSPTLWEVHAAFSSA